MLCDDLGGWDSGEWGGREGPEGGLNIAGSLHCTEETNTAL